MNLEEAKELFKKYHAEEAGRIEGSLLINKKEASCVWYGFKSALKITGQLEG